MTTKLQPILPPEEDDQMIPYGGAPADFTGPVYPNPTGIEPKSDTDPGGPVTTSLTGGAKMDTSNSDGNQMEIPGMEAGAKMGTMTPAPTPEMHPAPHHAGPSTAPAESAPLPAMQPEQQPEDLGAIANGPTAQPSSILGDKVAPGAAIAPNQMHDAGKAQFHDQMRQFGMLDAQNTTGMLALDPKDPNFQQKLANYAGQQKMIDGQRAHFEQMHPWGSPESAHPGVLGKIGHVLGEIGNAAGGNALNIPGSQQNLANKVATADEGVKQAGENALNAARPGLEQKKIDVKDEANDINQQKADDLAKKNTGQNAVQLRKQGLKLDPQGNTIPISVDEMSDNEKAGLAYKAAQTDAQESRKLIADLRANPNSPENQQKMQRLHIMAADAGTRAGMLGIAKDRYLGDYLGLDPEGNPLAGAETDEKTGKPIGPKMREKGDSLSAATKTMVEASPHVLQLSQKLRQEIESQKAALGPAASRWSEYMSGKVGAPNADFTKLRTDAGLLQTLLMRMHVGARGGEHMMDHFKGLMDTGKQSPENLMAALDEVDSYAHDVAGSESAGKIKKHEDATHNFEAPSGAPVAPSADGHKLKDKTGNVIAVSRGGKWQAP